MNLAVISVCALALAVIVSCVSRLNVGVLAIALAWIVGVYIGEMPVNTVMAGFPEPAVPHAHRRHPALRARADATARSSASPHHAVRLCRGNSRHHPDHVLRPRRAVLLGGAGQHRDRRADWPRWPWPPPSAPAFRSSSWPSWSATAPIPAPCRHSHRPASSSTD